MNDQISTIQRAPSTREDSYVANRAKFEGLFAEWLANRAVMAVEQDDATMDAADFRDIELARQITGTPAPYVDALFIKIEVMKHYLDESLYTDNRPIVLFAGIEADLRRLSISDRSAS